MITRITAAAALSALPSLALLACTITTEPAIYGGPGDGYGVQSVADEQGNQLLTDGDSGEDGLSVEVVRPEPIEVDVKETEGASEDDVEEIGAIFPNGSLVETTADLHLRAGPAKTYDSLRVMPLGSEVKVINGVPDEGFLQVEHNGLEGYASYRFLREIPEPSESAPPAGSSSGEPSSGETPAVNWRTRAIQIAKGAVGLSYWWGHGRLYNGTVTSSIAGSCSGACPNCTHRGSYGADCSGYVAKAWVVPASNTIIDKDTHPYHTGSFHNTTGNGQWSQISRAAVKIGDSFVYRSNGAGHIFIYEKGDAWGSPWAYEARSCRAGVVHNIRSASGYKAITLNR